MSNDKELEKETPNSAPEENKPNEEEPKEEPAEELEEPKEEPEKETEEEPENKIPRSRLNEEIAKRKKIEEELSQYRSQIEEIKSKISGTPQEKQEAGDALSELVEKYALDDQTQALLSELGTVIERKVLEKQAPLYSLAADIGWKNEISQLRNKYEDVDEFEGVMKEMAKDEKYNKLPAEDLYKLVKFERGETPKPKVDKLNAGVEGVKASPDRTKGKKSINEMTAEELEEELNNLGNFF